MSANLNCGRKRMAKRTQNDPVNLVVNLPWGAHCCHFYKTERDLLDIVVPYFKAGLLSNEFCIWITSNTPDIKKAVRAMSKALPQVDSYMNRGQFEILPYDQWYVEKRLFDPRRVLDGWIDKVARASARGYEGMRLAGDTLWLEKRIWKDFADYEEELDKTVAKHRIKAVCTYGLNRCQAFEVIDVVKNHGYTLIKRRTWEVIENAQRRRAEEKALEKAMAELERMVQLRTSELEDANRKLMVEVAERKRAGEELRASRERLRALAEYLQSVREEERTRIARELHDEIGQALTGIKLALERSVRAQGNPALAQALAVANDLIGQVRDMSLELRPAMLDDIGLLAALRWHFDRYTKQTKIKVDFKRSGLDERRFGPEIETAAYRIVQESLTNVARHGGIDKVEVGVWADETLLRIRIKDSGVGFDPASLPFGATGGLSGMRERAGALKGRVEIESAPGAGTLLTAELPLTTRVSAGAH